MFRSLNYNIKIIMTIQVINQNLFTESKRMIKLILCTVFIHYKILRRSTFCSHFTHDYKRTPTKPNLMTKILFESWHYREI
jgi:hypothetical protein